MKTIYKRILLKLSGESLAGEQGFGIDQQRVADYSEQIKEIVDAGVEVAVVIGGGNIFRGLKGAAQGVDRVKGDYMGMLATVINSLALSSGLDAVGQPSQVLTAVGMFPIGEQYSKWRAIEAMQQGKVAIMSCGTGNPFFTTDTGSALRGIEVGADVMLKGTRVHHHVQGKQPAHTRVQHGREGQPAQGGERRAVRHRRVPGQHRPPVKNATGFFSRHARSAAQRQTEGYMYCICT